MTKKNKTSHSDELHFAFFFQSQQNLRIDRHNLKYWSSVRFLVLKIVMVVIGAFHPACKALKLKHLDKFKQSE